MSDEDLDELTLLRAELEHEKELRGVAERNLRALAAQRLHPTVHAMEKDRAELAIRRIDLEIEHEQRKAELAAQRLQLLEECRRAREDFARFRVASEEAIALSLRRSANLRARGLVVIGPDAEQMDDAAIERALLGYVLRDEVEVERVIREQSPDYRLGLLDAAVAHAVQKRRRWWATMHGRLEEVERWTN